MKSIIINASIEFVLIGPAKSDDGILMQSTSASTDLIGLANKLYRFGIESELFNHESDYFQFLWTDFISKTGKKQKLLLCWIHTKYKVGQTSHESRIEYFFRKNIVTKSDKKSLQDTFDSFVENAYHNLSKLMEGQVSQEKHFEIINDQLLWHISPLLLECHYM